MNFYPVASLVRCPVRLIVARSAVLKLPEKLIGAKILMAVFNSPLHIVAVELLVEQLRRSVWLNFVLVEQQHRIGCSPEILD